jgi:hypothetical protein
MRTPHCSMYCSMRALQNTEGEDRIKLKLLAQLGKSLGIAAKKYLFCRQLLLIRQKTPNALKRAKLPSIYSNI